jgi:hypothetical protein
LNFLGDLAPSVSMMRTAPLNAFPTSDATW